MRNRLKINSAERSSKPSAIRPDFIVEKGNSAKVVAILLLGLALELIAILLAL